MLQKIEFINNVHKMSHNLNRVDNRLDLHTVFPAQNKLGSLGSLTDGQSPGMPCVVKHVHLFIYCAQGSFTVYYFHVAKCTLIRWSVALARVCKRSLRRQVWSFHSTLHNRCGC